jgi:nitrous oxidase accessory protein NosD
MKSSKNFRLFTSIALITLMVSLMFPAVARADDGTAPPTAVPAVITSSSGAATDPASPDVPATQVAQTQLAGVPSTDVAATQPAATQAPATVTSADNATQPAATQALVGAASTDTSVTQPAATPIPDIVTSTDLATQPAAAQTPSTAESDSTVTADATESSAVAALADSGSVLTDQNGNSIPLASAQAAEILGQSLPDPVVCPAGSANASAPGCVSGYTKISDAIAAASAGSVIFVESGTYTEQVVINKSLTLTGAGSASTFIQAPATLTSDADGNKDLIDITGALTIANISGFTISGPGPSHAGCGSGGINYGIYVRGGATAHISNNVITNISDSPISGCQNGVAIRVGSKALGQIGKATITNNTISDYQKGGIVIDNTGSYADIEGNVVEGVGDTTATAQNGIQISRGATATIADNTVSDNFWTGTYGGSNDPLTDPDADSSAGILLYLAGTTTISNNQVIDNQLGIASTASTGLNINNNTILGGSPTTYGYPTGIGLWDYDAYTGTEVETTGSIKNNLIESNDYGILIDYLKTSNTTSYLNINLNSIINNNSNTLHTPTYGVWSNTLTNATNNWWNNASGPLDNTVIPDACWLTLNNPAATANRVSDCVLYNPWLVTNPFAISGGNGSSSSEELSSLIIPVTGGQPAMISCVDPSEMFQIGDVQVTFTGLCNYEVVLDQLSKDGLPGNLGQDNNFVEGISVSLLKDGKGVNALPAGATIQVSYPNPSGNASILAWINSSWVEKPSSVIDDRVVANLDKPAINVIITH